MGSARDDVISLPSGRTFDPRRRRSAGPLDREELACCRSRNIDLAYDPAQIGWVVLTCEDDLDPGLDPGMETGGAAAARRSRDLAARRARCAALAGRYRLRPWRSSEVGTFVALLDDPRIWEHLPEAYPAPLTEELARDLIAISNETGHHEVLAVELEDAVVGQVRLAFDPTSPDRTEAEISYWLGRPCWGRGIGTDLVSLFTYLSFQRRRGLESIFARARTGNAASARVLEKSHYRYQGKAADDPAMAVYRVSRGDY